MGKFDWLVNLEQRKTAMVAVYFFLGYGLAAFAFILSPVIGD